jgi:hypothetical protein
MIGIFQVGDNRPSMGGLLWAIGEEPSRFGAATACRIVGNVTIISLCKSACRKRWLFGKIGFLEKQAWAAKS